jgi:hypothetical protein
MLEVHLKRMSERPLVTVVLPNYNHARFLPRRMESILTQTFKDYELIVLDDASTDNSREILNRYARHASIRFVFNDRNTGNPFKQWQTGARLAQGKYVWIAESDDYADPRFLEVLVSRLERNPGVGLAYCQSFEVDENGSIRGTLEHWTRELDADRWKQDFVNCGSDELSRYLVRRNTILNASAVVVRRDLLLEAAQPADRLRLSGDWLTWARVLMGSDVAFVAEPLNYFRCHGGSVRDTTKNPVACEECFDVMAYICSRVAVAPAVRRQALIENFYMVQLCYVRGPLPDFSWVRRVITRASRVHWSAVVRMGWYITKRELRQVGFIAVLCGVPESERSRKVTAPKAQSGGARN